MRKISERALGNASAFQDELLEMTDFGERFVTEKAGEVQRLIAKRIDPKPTMEINYKELRDVLTDEEWISITSRTVDKKKLETEIARGNISQKVVSACIKYVPHKSHFRIEVTSDDTPPDPYE